jgi:transposase
MTYSHYIALDWSKENMAIAILSEGQKRPKVEDVKSDIRQLKRRLINLDGPKILTFEETTSSRWLHRQVKDLVDRVLVCDPYKNHLLTSGAKTDKLDAEKLALLLKADCLSEVYQPDAKVAELRTLISGYEDLIKRGVRAKNQRSAVLMAAGLDADTEAADESSRFVLSGLENTIEQYELERKRYYKEFERLAKKFTLVRWLTEIPGIGVIGAVKIYAIVGDGARFKHRNNFLAYSGLVRLEKLSGGRSYGSRKPRSRRALKAVFKTAALAAIAHDGSFNDYYHYLITEKRYPDHQARHAVARKIATAVYGVMKNKKKYDFSQLGALRNLSQA